MVVCVCVGVHERVDVWVCMSASACARARVSYRYLRPVVKFWIILSGMFCIGDKK